MECGLRSVIIKVRSGALTGIMEYKGEGVLITGRGRTLSGVPGCRARSAGNGGLSRAAARGGQAAGVERLSTGLGVERGEQATRGWTAEHRARRAAGERAGGGQSVNCA